VKIGGVLEKATRMGKNAPGIDGGTGAETDPRRHGKNRDHQTKAADLLGISERMLRYKLKKYNLKGRVNRFCFFKPRMARASDGEAIGRP